MGVQKKVAVVLFNLGGPDNLEAVKPFLFNLFYDPAIISLPNPLRFILAKLISSRRTKTAEAIYKEMGGKSPIIEETKNQAIALERAISKQGKFKVFFFMRYWKPCVDDVINDVVKYKPDEVVLLPLYPQFSTTTTASGFKYWRDNLKGRLEGVPMRSPCCYYDHTKFVESYTDLTLKEYAKAQKSGKPRVLFSAHGIPKNRIEMGDPYEYQVQKSVEAIVKKINVKNLDYKICYQSKVGPLEWLGPSTEHEIKMAAKVNIPLVIVPIAFVSEHSETLVELDIEYKHLAEQSGLKAYYRVPAITKHPKFIACLADIVLHERKRSCDFQKCAQSKVA
jgi:ferrochelatase